MHISPEQHHLFVWNKTKNTESKKEITPEDLAQWSESNTVMPENYHSPYSAYDPATDQ